MKLRPNENTIIGGWVEHHGKIVCDDNYQRIEWLCKNYLTKISTTDGGWTTIYQDTNDGRYWQHSYPQGYLHGGGPPMLECLTPATVAYQKIKKELHASLTIIGYEIIDEQYNGEVFGSRYIIWSNHQKGVRLIWDGRDSWFRLETSKVLPISNKTGWIEIECRSYNVNENNSDYVDEIANQMLDSIVKYQWGKLS